MNKIALMLLCAAAYGETKGTEPPKKFLSADEAIQFVEAVALKFQVEAEVEARRRVADEAKRNVDTILTELRKKAGVAAECQPSGTGSAEAGKRYYWQCPEPAAKPKEAK